MKIKSYKKVKNNQYKIYLEDNRELTLYDEIILKYNLLLKKELSKKEIVEIIKENQHLSCYFSALNYLNYKNRSKKEIRGYLKKKNYLTQDIENAIKLLEEKKLINESEYLKLYIKDQIHLTNNGPKKITRKLIDLGFLEVQIQEELFKIPKEVWQEKLEKIILKKIKANKKDSASKIKEKICMYCLSEGFQKEDILGVLNTYKLTENTFALEKEALKLYKKLSLKYQGNELIYQIKGRLFRKGFSYEKIENAIENIKKTSD